MLRGNQSIQTIKSAQAEKSFIWLPRKWRQKEKPFPFLFQIFSSPIVFPMLFSTKNYSVGLIYQTLNPFKFITIIWLPGNERKNPIFLHFFPSPSPNLLTPILYPNFFSRNKQSINTAISKKRDTWFAQEISQGFERNFLNVSDGGHYKTKAEAKSRKSTSVLNETLSFSVRFSDSPTVKWLKASLNGGAHALL